MTTISRGDPVLCLYLYLMTLSEKIIAARKQAGLTQEELAVLTGITVRTIQRIESGESVPRAFTLKAIAKALQKPYEYFVSEGVGTGNHSSPENPEHTRAELSALNPGLTRDMLHFLQMLNLSCFAYLPIPFVHFLIPLYLLKKKKGLGPEAVAWGRKIILQQVYWLIITHLLLLGTMIFNHIQFTAFQSRHLLSYLLPVFVMYALDAVLIIRTDIRIRKMGRLLNEASTY